MPPGHPVKWNFVEPLIINSAKSFFLINGITHTSILPDSVIEIEEKERFLTAPRSYSVELNITIVKITHLLVMLAPFLNFPIPKTVMKLP